MSIPSWEERLRQTASKYHRVAVVGVGQDLREDDAAGLLVARSLESKPDVMVIDAGVAPENINGTLRQFAPEVIILIDAVCLNLPPGTITCLSPEGFTGISASTHTLPLNLIMAYWAAEFHCEVVFFGIQPGAIEFGESVTLPVWRAVCSLSSALTSALALKRREIVKGG